MESIMAKLAARDEEQEALVRELRGHIEALKAQVTARDNLLAVAAHELRNPMHAMLLQVTAALAIAKREQTPELVRRLERIRHIVDTYVKRATLLLDVMRLDARGWPVERRSLDLTQVVREIVTSYEPEAQYAGCEVRVHLAEALHGAWDRLAVEQIFSNLLSNAIKYGAGAPIDITLLGQEGQAVLKVQDRGVGIANADRARIFERFEQAVGSRERRSGFGIGLWLVRSLVEAHGGSIAVDSELGRGSTFVVCLPGLAGEAGTR